MSKATVTKGRKSVPQGIDPDRVPNHIAIIMDGNGRWAQQRRRPRVAGHRAGAKSAKEIIRACDDLGVRYLTLYTFSAENWRRPRAEVDTIMRLIRLNLAKEIDELDAKNVRLNAIGRLHKLPQALQTELFKDIERTRQNTGLHLTLALNYGGQAEIADAARAIAQAAAARKLEPQSITESTFAQYLYWPDLPPVDLLIRTGGELRISNFLLWQMAYGELWVTPVLWPEFGVENLLQAVADYQRRERRFGGLRTDVGR